MDERNGMSGEATRREWLRVIGSSLVLSASGAGVLPLAMAQQVHAAVADVKSLSGGPAYQPKCFTPHNFQTLRKLADLIIPADEHSPSATSIGIVDFIDEWVSAPYPECQRDRPIVLAGFSWLDAEAGRRHGKGFAELAGAQQTGMCDEICDAARAAPAQREAAHFFARYRDLTAGGFYSSPVGRKDLGYIGNVPLARFEGPPRELLKKLNLV